MKRLLKTVAALAALATPAAAADAAFPKDMLGVWCHDGTKYVRGDCPNEHKFLEMPSDTLTLETRSAPNGGGHTKYRLLTRDHLDGRTSAAKQFDAVTHAIAEDLGGEDRLSAIQKYLVEAFAGVSIHLGDLHARLLLGEKIDITEHATAVSTMVRIATRVGVRRIPREVESIDEYIARKYPQAAEEDAAGKEVAS